MVHPAWSLYVFGSLSAVAGLLAAFSLTETLGHPLPNTFEVFLPNSYLRQIPFQDLERMKAEAKPTWKCVWPSRDEDKEKLASAYSLSSASVTRVA